MEGKPALTALVGNSIPFLSLLCLLLLVPMARAEEEDLRSLELYNGSELETVSVGRSPRPASQTAENITVVTAREIEALNAHDLADVLYTVAGVQLEEIRTPGTSVTLTLQGSKFNHTLVLIDNVPINNLADNFPDIGLIPVQMIERIEVVKGAASSSWGNALGGVINIITKSPQTERPFGGLVSASAGKASTIDARGEMTGTAAGIGYYLTGGKLRSDGLLPNNMSDLNHFYGKLHYDLPQRGTLSATALLLDSSAGQVQVPTQNGFSDSTQLIATFSAQYPLTDRLSIDGMYRTRHLDSTMFKHTRPTDLFIMDKKDDEDSNGAVVKLSYLDDLQRLVAGVDYDHLNDHVTAHMGATRRVILDSKGNDNRVGVYLNDTFTLGRFAITPSARFDHTEIQGNLFSPSFGVTYAVTDNSVLRAYTAKGYSLTSLNRDDTLEKVWTSQVGFESADIPYLWLKGTLFRNETWDIVVQNPDGSTTPNQRQLKQGYEIEARTLPLFATSLSLGYTYIDSIAGIARHTLNLGVKYEDSRHLRALLTGHYIDWRQKPDGPGQYRDIIWDLYLGKKFFYSEIAFVELFGSVRNLFNGDQFQTPIYSNPGRWAEVGVKCTF